MEEERKPYLWTASSSSGVMKTSTEPKSFTKAVVFSTRPSVIARGSGDTMTMSLNTTVTHDDTSHNSDIHMTVDKTIIVK